MPERTGEDLGSSDAPDARLAEALRPSVEAALSRSVRDEPHTWAQAFFPILLPAIRLAIVAGLRDMVETLNQALEQSLSLQSWRWRLEAWRTSKPFAEIVLLRTLVYRVEQVLLVDRHTGLLLASVADPQITPKNSDLISGMLTAIQEFIHDSFEVEKTAGIRELQLGDFSLWVEQGPQAALAAAVRGTAPAQLRETLRAAIDLVHQEFGPELRHFRGDAAPFARCRTILEGCLQARYQRAEKTSYTKLWLCAAAVGAVLLAWAIPAFQQAQRWNGALAALRRIPGITITQVTREGGRYVVAGLRDPLSASPEAVLADRRIDPHKVSWRFRPFLSLEPELVLERARAAIDAPATVSASLDHDVLVLEGAASHSWILQAREAVRQLALTGIRGVRTAGLADRDLEAQKAEIEAVRFLFAVDSSMLPREEAELDRTTAMRARQWVSGVLAIGGVPQIEVLGYADRSGTEAKNRPLSRNRAEHVAELLAAAGVPREALVVRGQGSSSTQEGGDPALARKVVLRLHLVPGRQTGETQR